MKRFVVSIKLWYRCSADYDAAQSTMTLLVDEAATIGGIMEWAEKEKRNALGSTDPIITVAAEGGGE